MIFHVMWYVLDANIVDDWKECCDAKSGKTYYYSKSRKQSRWDKPESMVRSTVMDMIVSAKPQVVPLADSSVASVTSTSEQTEQHVTTKCSDKHTSSPNPNPNPNRESQSSTSNSTAVALVTPSSSTTYTHPQHLTQQSPVSQVSASRTNRFASPSPMCTPRLYSLTTPAAASNTTAIPVSSRSSTPTQVNSASHLSTPTLSYAVKPSDVNSNRLPKAAKIANWQKAVDPKSGREYWFNR